MTDWGLIAIRFALYANLMLLVGLAAFPLYSFSRAEWEADTFPSLRLLLSLLALIGGLLSVVGFGVSTAHMLGIPISDLDSTRLATMASQTDQGIAWIVRLVVLTALFISLVVLKQNQTAYLLTTILGGTIALATLLWSGHAGATEGSLRIAHRISDIAHMVAASIWLGGIAAFAVLLGRPALDNGHVGNVANALAKFAPAGTIAVAILILTGLFNAYAIMGHNAILHLQSEYGAFLSTKIGLVGIMTILASNNRWRLTPALEQLTDTTSTEAAWTKLRISIALEATAGVAVLALVSWLGTLDPGGG